MTVVAIPMDGTRHAYRLADALSAVCALETLPYEGSGIVPPSHSAAVKMREALLAVGPFTEAGPKKLTLTPSIKGGVCATFFYGDEHRVVACMNNGRTLYVTGGGPGTAVHAEDVSFEEAVRRASC